MTSHNQTARSNEIQTSTIAFFSAITGGVVIASITAHLIGLLPLAFFSPQSPPQVHVSTVAKKASLSTVSITGKDSDEEIAGSGFIVSSSGYIVTCAHVVADRNAQYTVTTSDGKTYPVQIVSLNTSADVALLKISPSAPLTALPLGNSSNLQMGEAIIAVGNPYGMLSGTVTTGIVSGIHRNIFAESSDSDYSQAMQDLIQIDAPINPGESGGPVLNNLGQVIGISEASDTRAQNISFAVPVNNIKQIIENYSIG